MLRTLAHAARSIALCAAALLLNAAPAAAQSAKIATDLQAVLSAGTTPVINWARDVNGVRYVKVLIVSNADDAELSNLRKAVMAAGGSIYYRYSSVLALAALLPAGQGGRHRRAQRRAEHLAQPADDTLGQHAGKHHRCGRGARHRQHQLQPAHRLHRSWHRHRVPRLGHRRGSTPTSSGDGGESRVRESISLTKAGDAVRAGVTDWTPGIDVSGTLNPASPTMVTYLTRIQNGFAPKADRYGHGSHVAAVAAGRGMPTARPTPPASRPTPTCSTCACSTTTATASCPTCWPAWTGSSTTPSTRTSASSTSAWRRLDRVVPHRPAGARRAQRGGPGHRGGGGGRQLRPQRRGQGKLRHHQLAGARAQRHHRRLGQQQGQHRPRRRHRQPLQLARAHARRLGRRSGKRQVDNLLKPDLVAPATASSPRWAKTPWPPAAPGTSWPRATPDLTKVAGAGQAADKA
jgi:hypothetical protein